MTAVKPSRPSLALYALSAVGLLALVVEALCLLRLRRRPEAEATHHPGCSIVKPLAGNHQELARDLESHAAIDYPGDWELLLGVPDEDDPAAPVARALAARHPDRVRVLTCAEEPGHNLKVNQLLTLTPAARHEVIVCTDGNTRVYASYLRDIAAALERPKVGLVTNLVSGAGERRLGAAFDNQAWVAFVAPNVATAATLGIDQVVGKSMALRRSVLERAGGWEALKDGLGEDQQLGTRVVALGLRCHVCATPVENVQVNESLRTFWTRQTRWATIRRRVLGPGFFLEPLLNTTLLSGLALAASPRSRVALALTAAVWACALALTQAFALVLRGRGFSARHLALFPLQQLLLFLAWTQGATRRTFVWNGRVFSLGGGTALTPIPEAAPRH